MIIPSLKRIGSADLSLLYVDAMRQWANNPAATRHADLAIAVSDELEHRGKPVPEDEVRPEAEIVLAFALKCVDHLKARAGH